MSRFDAMQHFIRVADLGSFAAAADQLGVARSVVTRRIAALEEHLGVKLITRTTRKLTLTSAVLEVDLTSVDVDNDEANDELATKTWFNTPAFPKARFESTSVKALPTAGQYEVVGTLTIKGQKQTVTVPARFTEKAGQGVFEGKLTIQRGAFSIGEGAWKAFDIVANDVVVHFQLTAK